MVERSLTTVERLVSTCGQIGVITNAARIGHENRAARRERIRGRTRRCGNDEAVGIVVRKGRPINLHLNLHKLRAFAAADDNIVQSMKALLSPGRARDFCDQKISRAQNEIVSDDCFHHARDLTHSGTRKESEGTNIDSQNRPDGGPELVQNAQDRSVAAHHDEQVRPFARVNARRGSKGDRPEQRCPPPAQTEFPSSSALRSSHAQPPGHRPFPNGQ